MPFETILQVFRNPRTRNFLDSWINILNPLNVVIVDTAFCSTEEPIICKELVKQGSLIRLSGVNRFLALSDPADVARMPERTFIATKDRERVNNDSWREPRALEEEIKAISVDAYKGKTMYVIPFIMGVEKTSSDVFCRPAIQLSDSPYVVLSMTKMTRVNDKALELVCAEDANNVTLCMHACGGMDRTFETPEEELRFKRWACEKEKERKFVAQFPEENIVLSYGSGYGGNSLLGKKCLALRISSYQAAFTPSKDFLAEHMLILAATHKQTGDKRYLVASFPSCCGKTNLAMITSCLPDYKFTCVGDDIAWLRWDVATGRLMAVNPEKGMFGVAPGTNSVTNAKVMKRLGENVIFTNVAYDPITMEPWWELKTEFPPNDTMINWKGEEVTKKGAQWSKEEMKVLAHPNSRFCVECSSHFHNELFMDESWDTEVPIDAIIFGSRRPSVIPLVLETRSWNQGTLLASTMASKPTAARISTDGSGKLWQDPMAMLDFVGYDVGQYFRHWLKFAKLPERDGFDAVFPKIFMVNWFREGNDGQLLWDGFSENSRILKYILERCKKPYDTTVPLSVPDASELDTTNMSATGVDNLVKALSVDPADWLNECERMQECLDDFCHGDIPGELVAELDAIKRFFQERK